VSTALCNAPAAALAESVRGGKLTAVAVVEAFLRRIREVDGDVRAFIEVDGDGARARAVELDRERAAGRRLGRLAGVPVAVKDLFAHAGRPVTCASRILAGYTSPYTATAIARLEAEDAIVLGRTNMDEFAMGSSTEHSAYGPTRNPFDTSRIPGGSSGGSAAAVAARMAPLALGSDTGGSVRQPAAMCGVTGLKPTYGRISRHGLIAYASSLDHVGIFARAVGDLALALQVVAGADDLDATCSAAPVPDYVAGLREPVAGLRIGVPREYFAPGLDADVERLVRAALAALEGLGARLVPVSLPSTPLAVPAYYLIATAEASSNLARYDGVRYGQRAAGDLNLDEMYARTRASGFGDEVKLRILLGTFCLSRGYYDAWYGKATQVRTLIRRELEQALATCDLLAAPTSPVPAFKLGEKLDDPLAMYLCDALTVAANLAGVPAISVPCGLTREGLPAGLQLIGPVLGEGVLLRAAAAYATSSRHDQLEPALATGGGR
jgi:aspartyl-tRNA(Asn)/glutamyl-tRNA(Gln) amidotransferase subunit A